MIQTTQNIAAIEMSSSRCQLSFINEFGNPIWCSNLPQVKTTSPGGFLTHSPHHYLSSIRKLFQMAIDDGLNMKSLAGIGVAATTPTPVLVDKHGRPVTDNAYLWHDPKLMGEPNLARNNTGLRKLTAIALAEPDMFVQAKWALDATDFLVAVFTNKIASSNAALIQKYAWSEANGFSLEGLARYKSTAIQCVNKIPGRVCRTGEVVGGVSHRSAQHFSIPQGIPVVHAGYDSVAAMVGGGIRYSGGGMMISLGTSVTMYMSPSTKPNGGTWVARGNVLPGKNHVISGGFAAGLQGIQLVREELNLKPTDSASHDLVNRAAELESKLDPAVLRLPFASQEMRSPLAGLSLPTVALCNDHFQSNAQRLAAIRRGVCCFIKYAIEDLRSRGVKVDRLSVTGGGSQSESFVQQIADYTNLPVRIFGSNAAAEGAALLALEAVCGEPAMMSALGVRWTKARLKRPDRSPKRQYLCGQVYANFETLLQALIKLSPTGLALSKVNGKTA